MIENLAAGVTAFTSNAYLVAGERPVLIDAGADFDVVDRIQASVDGIDAVVLTHTHRDHVGNLDAVRSAFGVDAVGFDADRAAVDRSIADGETIRVGDHAYEALHTPGHAGDHLCLYAAEPGVLFSGDLIFQNGSVGRTDLPGGDRTRLIESVERVRETTGDDLRELHPGHGPSVTEGASRHVELARRFAGG